MAVKIRLQRVGRTDEPYFRIIAIETRERRDGKALDTLGFYYPKSKPKSLKINKEKLMNWIKNGAIASETVRRLADL